MRRFGRAIADVGHRLYSVADRARSRILRRRAPKRRSAAWSIAMYAGPSPLELQPVLGIRNPVLTSADVTDVRAEFVADPFMIRQQGAWQMLFEVKNGATRKGEIGLATSADGHRWSYEGIVLAEPFHISYPFVFEWDGDVFMVPETARAGAVRLYRGDPAPAKWTFVHTLVEGQDLADASLFHTGDRWWMLVQSSAMPRHDTLRLYSAPHLFGAWREHPASPVVQSDPRSARPAGRVLRYDNGLLRFAQDCSEVYGSAVRAFQVVTLTPEEYRDRPVGRDPLLSGSGQGWNARGMHHVDAHRVGEGEWLACVDGWTRPVNP